MRSTFVFLVAAFTLQIQGCNKSVRKTDQAKIVDYKRDELIVTVESFSKIEKKEDIKDLLVEGDSIKSTEILASYFEGGKYKTVAKLKFDAKNLANNKASLESDPKVKSSSFNYIYEGNPFDMDEETTETVEDFPIEYEALQHKLLKTQSAHLEGLGEGLIVAVTDTGVDYNHPDLKNNIWYNELEMGLSPDGLNLCNNQLDEDENGKIDDCRGWDFASDDNDPMPNSAREYHGSHVSGIIAAASNGEGVVGVSPASKVMAIKFYGSGKWTSEMIFNSYKYSVENGAKVINTSFNVDKFVNDMTYRSALDLVYAKGGIVVNSAGNGGRKDPVRSILSKVLFVANTSVSSQKLKSDLKVRSSNWGYGVDVSAPGDKIVSTILDGEYKAATGTSMSAPVVAGALALVWSKHPEWSREQVIARLLSTTDRIDQLNPDLKHELGTGRINLEKAMSDDDHRLTTIIGVKDFITEGSKSLRVLLDGQIDWTTLSESSVELYRVNDDAASDLSLSQLVENASVKQEINLEDNLPYAYGSNWINIKLKDDLNFEQGSYIVRVSNDLLDPFERAIDANSDGVLTQDEQYLSLVKVEKIDIKGPTLDSIRFTSENKVVSPDSGPAVYELKVSDDLSGVKSLSIKLSLKGSTKFNENIKCADNCTIENGIVRFEIPKAYFKVNGTYYINRIYLEDFVGHKSKYIILRNPNYYVGPHYSDVMTDIAVSSTEFETEGFSDLDNTKPVLQEVFFDSNSYSRGEKATLKMNVKEEDSGLKYISANFRGVNKYKVISIRPQPSNITDKSHQELTFYTPKDYPEDEYLMVSIKIVDEHNNSAYYSCNRKVQVPKIIGTQMTCPAFYLKNSSLKSM